MAIKTTAFTGPVVVGLNNKKGEVRLTDGKNVNEAKYISLEAPTTITADTTLTLPNGAGSAGQVLSTDGTGVLSFINAGGGGTEWQPVITTNTTAAAGQGFFVNTSGGAVTLTLPLAPSQGDEVAFVDYAGTANTNNITIGRNGENIQGSGSDLIINTNRAANTLVYADATQGWLLKNV